MTINFDRACQLIVGIEKGVEDALDFSQFRIVFKVGQALVGQPAIAEILIYNVSAATMNKFIGVGQAFALYAGYKDNMGLIFQGEVFQFRRGRESPTDTYLAILAQNANTAHNFAVVKGTLAKDDNTALARRAAIMDAMREHGAEAGIQTAVAEDAAIRGKTYFKQARDALDDEAKSTNQEWGYDGNQVVIIDRNRPADALAFILNTKTGLVGMPQLTAEGLRVSSLLNHRLKIGGQVQVNEASVQTQAFDASYQAQASNVFKDPKMGLGADGFYNIISVEHAGDTRGDVWRTDVVGWGVGAIAPVSGVAIQGVANSV